MGEMQEQSDAQLLREYAERGCEPAFREIVTRHADLVYSAALRCVNSSDLACDVAQSVFTDLSRKARPLADKLADNASLVGWLYRSTRFAALNQLRDDRRRLAHERQAMEQLLSNSETAPDWDRIRPVLDEAMNNLKDEDRDALLLRYFKNHDFRNVGRALGVSDDAAQKRVSRAVEHLREFFTKRGVTVGASGLVVIISANAVQAAPAGLAVTISTAAIFAGTTITSAATATAIKTIAMTTLQKTIITAALAAVAGAGIYEARQAAQLREQNHTLQQQQAPLAEQNQQLQRERDDATNRLAGLLAEILRLKSNPNQSELLKLRGQVTALSADATKRSQSDNSLADMAKSPQMREFMKTAMASSVDKVYAKLFADLHLTPDQESALKQLLISKTTAGMDAGTDMLSGKMTAAQQKQLVDQINAEKADVDKQIKELLSADGFAAYQAYDKNYFERAAVSGPAGFEEQLAGGLELTADQTEQLIQAMADERQNFKFTVDYSDKSKLTAGVTSMYSDENINRYQQEQEKLDQLYVTRAQTILSPDQLAVFQKFLSNRRAMGAMSLKMGAKMFGTKTGGN